jgi:hypothetical protein
VLLCSYELPHRIHTAKTYPLNSSNGSAVVIYGHEKGVKIIWRGGRPFKASKQVTGPHSQKPNGAQEAVISLDSDDEGTAPAYVDKPEFEDEEELDPSNPHPSILQDLDLYLGTDVVHLALLPTSFLKAEGESWRGLHGLKEKIVFAASCSDNLVRLVILPLTPPSPTSKARPEFRSNFTNANAGNGSWGETVILLNGHQKPSSGVAMTAEVPGRQAGAYIIVASHSREITGSLLLYRISISSPTPHSQPFQRILLNSPAVSISFSPSLSQQRSSHLLVADATGVCRIYDYSRIVKSPVADEPVPGALLYEQGTWLLSLYPGFQKNKNETSNTSFRRKSITDAQWVLGGKAILALLNDGEWGIWDIEGAGPVASQGLLSRQGIKGGSRSEFSLTGFIEGIKSRAPAPPQIGSKLMPMTPATRKAADPFGSKLPSGPLRGQISIVEVPPASPSNPPEESIIFWLGDSFASIPSLSKYWAANSRKSSNGGNLFNGTPGGRMTKLENIDLQGERCSGIDQVAKQHTATGLPTDVLILGEHRFTILSVGKPTSQFQAPLRMALVEKNTNVVGELDVVGIDQALARMESSNTSLVSKSRLYQ